MYHDQLLQIFVSFFLLSRLNDDLRNLLEPATKLQPFGKMDQLINFKNFSKPDIVLYVSFNLRV
jgi:hypothetical protein